ncbi:MAG: hypothetical protein ACOX2Q_09125 [Dehalobacterium sp.]|jgi:uncharacterized protein YoxC
MSIDIFDTFWAIFNLVVALGIFLVPVLAIIFFVQKMKKINNRLDRIDEKLETLENKVRD